MRTEPDHDPYLDDAAEVPPPRRSDRWLPRVAVAAALVGLAGAAALVVDALGITQDPTFEVPEGFDPDDPFLENLDSGDFDPDFDPGAQMPQIPGTEDPDAGDD